jgi:hypothetical protein
MPRCFRCDWADGGEGWQRASLTTTATVDQGMLKAYPRQLVISGLGSGPLKPVV